jgi:hypothetical protein
MSRGVHASTEVLAQSCEVEDAIATRERANELLAVPPNRWSLRRHLLRTFMQLHYICLSISANRASVRLGSGRMGPLQTMNMTTGRCL